MEIIHTEKNPSTQETLQRMWAVVKYLMHVDKPLNVFKIAPITALRNVTTVTIRTRATKTTVISYHKVYKTCRTIVKRNTLIYQFADFTAPREHTLSFMSTSAPCSSHPLFPHLHTSSSSCMPLIIDVSQFLPATTIGMLDQFPNKFR